MRGKPVGSNVYLYVDLVQQVMPGDFIQAVNFASGDPTKSYLVTDVREQRRGMRAPRYSAETGLKVRCGRQHLRCDVVPLEAPQEAEDAVIHRIVWYRG